MRCLVNKGVYCEIVEKNVLLKNIRLSSFIMVNEGSLTGSLKYAITKAIMIRRYFRALRNVEIHREQHELQQFFYLGIIAFFTG